MLLRSISILSLLATLAACGEYKQQVEYVDGGYQGKTDQRHWDNASFNHDQAAWAETIHERTLQQNEHVRINAGRQQEN